MIPEEFINDLNQRINIAEVIGRYVELKQSGKEFKGLCPFHNEKTPSFTVNPEKQFYHCFGCNEGGNAIQFLMKHDGKSFRDAVDELASSVGLELPDKTNGNRQRRSADNGKSAYDLIERVSTFYQERLLGSQADPEASAYLKKRGIDRETAEHFRLGYAPNSWDAVLKKFGKTATQRRQLEDIGLIVRKEKDDGHFYDRFRNRLMFPIMDQRANVLGFGGRAIGDQQPKYMNSPTTELFRKSHELFGIVQADESIINTGQALVVEGFTDVLSLHARGITNAVASCGTAVTGEHVRRLFAMADEVIFSFDGDDAGRTAARKTSMTALTEMSDGKMASLMYLPEGHDPDSIIRSEPEWYEQLGLPTRSPVLETLLGGIGSVCDMDRLDGRARFRRLADEIIELLPESGLLRHIVSDYCDRISFGTSSLDH